MDCLHLNKEDQTLEATQVKGYLKIYLDGKPKMKCLFYKNLKIKFVFEDYISATKKSLEERIPKKEIVPLTHITSFQRNLKNDSVPSLAERMVSEDDITELVAPQTSFLKAESVFGDRAGDSCRDSKYIIPCEANDLGGQKLCKNNSETLSENINCVEGFNRHSLTLQNNPLAGFHCKLCQKWFPGTKKEREHQRNPECRTTCEQCGLVYPCKGDLFKHQYEAHDIDFLQNQFKQYDLKKDAKRPCEKDKVTCPICSNSIVSRHFRYHINTHFDEPSYKCCACGDTLKTASSYYKHCKDHLMGAPSSLTMQCKRSPVKESRLKHKVKVDPKIQNKKKTMKLRMAKDKEKNKAEKSREKKNIRDKTLPLLINRNATVDKSDQERYDECTDINLDPMSTTVGTMDEVRAEGETEKQAMEERIHRCNYCKKTFVSQERLRAHKETPSLDLKCKMCDAVLPSQAWMIIHEFEVHNTFLGLGQGDASDPIDPSGYRGVDKGSSNGQRAKSRQYVSCPVCSLKVTRIVLPEHIMRMHTQESPFICCLCNFPCSNQNLYRKHCEEHMGKLRRGLFRCSSCPEVFQDKSEFHRHVMVHKSICHFCNVDFKHSNLLQVHYNTCHYHQLLKCSQCEKRFPSEHKLKEHERHHLYKVRRPCPKCGAMVCRLSIHMHRSHPEPGAEFLCSMCPKKFKSQIVLNIHLRRHAANKSGETFTCPKCPKTFNCREYLTDHIKIHLDRKLYDCQICGKQCTEKSNLRIHMRIHSDQKLFNCDVCGQGFNYKASLLNHQKSKHKSWLP